MKLQRSCCLTRCNASKCNYSKTLAGLPANAALHAAQRPTACQAELHPGTPTMCLIVSSTVNTGQGDIRASDRRWMDCSHCRLLEAVWCMQLIEQSINL